MKFSNYKFFLLFLTFTFLVGCGESEQSTPEEILDTTEQVIEDEVVDYNQLSYKELEVLVNENDPVAQYMLGVMYEYGTEDVKQDFEEAYSLYEASAQWDNADATCALGYFYLTGTYVEQDLDKALTYFEQAIEFGGDNAKVGKARVLLAGIDIENYLDLDEAEDSLDSETELDLDAGDVDTENAIEGSTSEDSDEPDEDIETVQVEADLAAIYSLVNEAYRAGDLDGGYYMGYLYNYGLGVDRDLNRAVDYYTEVGDSESSLLTDQLAINQSNTALGLILLNGDADSELEADSEAAIERLQMASDNGYAKAAYYLGQIYENGIGADKDLEKAMEYYLVAADSDFAPALNQIGYMYYNGLGVDVDFSSAVYYQKLAALQGYAKAQVNLGYLYENGYGVERNLETALEYYEMAAESNYEGANEAVVRVKTQINAENEN